MKLESILIIGGLIGLILIGADIYQCSVFKNKCESIGGHILITDGSALCLSEDDRVPNERVEDME